jgi:hypothetical protein
MLECWVKAMAVKITVFCKVTPKSLAAFLAYTPTMMMEAMFCCETSVYLYQTARHHIPEDDRLTIHKLVALYLEMTKHTAREVNPQPSQALAVVLCHFTVRICYLQVKSMTFSGLGVVADR